MLRKSFGALLVATLTGSSLFVTVGDAFAQTVPAVTAAPRYDKNNAPDAGWMKRHEKLLEDSR